MDASAHISGTSSVNAKLRATLTYNFATVHLQSAQAHAALAFDIAKETSFKTDITQQAQYISLTTSSIISAFCFVEAFINHFIYDCSVSPESRAVHIKSLPTADLDQVTLLSAYDLLDNLPTLEKYQFCLALFHKPCFDSGAEPYQGVATVKTLRNALVHYHPTAVDTVEGSGEKLEKRLSSDKVPVLPAEGYHYPKKYLSAERAQWSFERSISFTKEFYERLGLSEHYRQ